MPFSLFSGKVNRFSGFATGAGPLWPPPGSFWAGPLWAPWALMGRDIMGPCALTGRALMGTLVNQRIDYMANPLNILATLKWHNAISSPDFAWLLDC